MLKLQGFLLKEEWLWVQGKRAFLYVPRNTTASCVGADSLPCAVCEVWERQSFLQKAYKLKIFPLMYFPWGMQKLTKVSIYMKKAQAALKKIPEHGRILFFPSATTSPCRGNLTNSIHRENQFGVWLRQKWHKSQSFTPYGCWCSWLASRTGMVAIDECNWFLKSNFL